MTRKRPHEKRGVKRHLDGRASMVVEGALAERGIDTGSIEPEALFLLAHVLADIARRLPLVEGRAA